MKFCTLIHRLNIWGLFFRILEFRNIDPPRGGLRIFIWALIYNNCSNLKTNQHFNTKLEKNSNRDLPGLPCTLIPPAPPLNRGGAGTPFLYLLNHATDFVEIWNEYFLGTII